MINTIILIIILLIKKTINVDHSALIEKIETDPKVLKFVVNDRVKITMYKNIFNKGYTENLSR